MKKNFNNKRILFSPILIFVAALSSFLLIRGLRLIYICSQVEKRLLFTIIFTKIIGENNKEYQRLSNYCHELFWLWIENSPKVREVANLWWEWRTVHPMIQSVSSLIHHLYDGVLFRYASYTDIMLQLSRESNRKLPYSFFA